MKGQEPQREGIGIRIFYLDLFFAVELLVDFFLILAAALLAGREIRRLRFLGAAALSAALSAVILFPPLGTLPLLAVKLLTLAAVTGAAFGFRPVRAFLRAAVCLLAATALFGGCVYALSAAVSAPVLVHNMTFYFGGTPLLLIGAVTAVYFCVRLVLLRLGRRLPQRGAVRLAAVSGAGERAFSAFVDTGNRLIDGLSGRPVVVLSPDTAASVLPDDCLRAAEDWRAGRPPGRPFVLIPCETVAGDGLLIGFPDIRIDRLGRGGRVPTGWLAAAAPRGTFGALIGEEAVKNLGGKE